VWISNPVVGSMARSLKSAFNVFQTPKAMHESMRALLSSAAPKPVRNFTGVIARVDADNIVIESAPFHRENLQFYTRYNMGLTTDAEHAQHSDWFKKAQFPQGDYRFRMPEKMATLVDCLTKFPSSKRAVLSVVPSSAGFDHSRDGEAKCLRELHFYIEDGQLHCSGYMRAQAALIFPKNIHFIGSVMLSLGKSLGRPVGSYTHSVTTLVADQS